MKVIAQIDSLPYFEGKAHELITEAGRARTEDQDNNIYIDQLQKAIQVLALCIAHVQNQQPLA